MSRASVPYAAAMVALFVAAGVGVAWHAASPTFLRVVIPTSALESTALSDAASATSGGLSVVVTPGAIAFGPLKPGATSAPQEIKVTNTGTLPLRVKLLSSSFVERTTNAEIPADRFQAFSNPDLSKPVDVSGTRPIPDAILPGGVASVFVELRVPHGSEMWVPAGKYSGSITITVEAIS
ncbi:MAG: hypothetical protein WDA16_04940 [Candidatus Thermoplasmatota archaeon]